MAFPPKNGKKKVVDVNSLIDDGDTMVHVDELIDDGEKKNLGEKGLPNGATTTSSGQSGTKDNPFNFNQFTPQEIDNAPAQKPEHQYPKEPQRVFGIGLDRKSHKVEPVAENQIAPNITGQGSTEEIDYKNIKPASIEEAHDADKNVLGNLWNHFTAGVGKLSAAGLDLGGQFMVKLTPNDEFNFETDEKRLKKIREDVIEPTRTATTELVGANVTPEQKAAFEKGFITRAAGGLAEMLPAMGGKGAGLILQGYDSGLEAINSTPNGKDLPENTKTIYGATVGTVVGLMNMLALDKIFGKQTSKVASEIAANTLNNLVKKEGVEITADMANKAIMSELKTLKSKIVNGSLRVGKGGVIQGAVGAANEGANILAETILNKSQDKPIFDEHSWKENLSRVAEAGASGFVGGAILGGLSVPFSKTRDYISEKVSEAKSADDITNLKNELINSKDNGKLSEQEAQKISDVIDDYVRVNRKVPDDVPNRKEVVNKIMQREDVENEISKKQDEIQNVDKAFQPEMQQEITTLQNKANEINDEIKNPEISQPIELSVGDKQEWDSLPIAEKLKLARENLPEVKDMSDTEVAKIADARAKELLGNRKIPEINETETTEIPDTKTEASTTNESVDKVEQPTEQPKGKYASKAKKLADKVRSTELPKWLANNDPNIHTSGVDLNDVKNALATSIEKVGELLDKGIELKDAIKDSADEFIERYRKALGAKSLKPEFENQLRAGFEAHYKENTIADKNTVGVSHNALTDLAKKIGLKEPARGTRLTPEQFAERGRSLLNAGADTEQLEKDFKEGKQPTADDISVARAHLEDLTKIADAMKDKWGTNSEQFKKANQEVDRWVNEVVKPMGTAASEPFTALQGERDLDTNSFVTVKRTVEEGTGKPTTPEQQKKIEELTSKNNELKKKADDLEAKLIEETNKNIGKGKGNKTYAEKAKNVADKFRKLKAKPLTFKDEKGNDIPVDIQGVSWNDLVELGAKAIEKTGELADGIAAIVDKVKDTDWYKNLSNNDKAKLSEQLQNHYEGSIKETPESKRIKYLEKQKEDLLNKKIPEKNGKIEYAFTDEEKQKVKDLEDEIDGLKKDLGITKGKVEKPLTEQEKIEADKKELEDIQQQFVDKKGNKFTPEEAKTIWDYAKKNYLDKGVSYRDMIGQVSNDLGLSWRQVSEAITTPKIKPISDAMWKKRYDYMKNQAATKNWVEAQSKRLPFKGLRKISAAFRGVSVFGHGGIFIGTHAGMTLFNPSQWKYVIPAFIRGWKFAYGKKADYVRRIEQLKNSPNYVLAQRAGLKNNPDVVNAEEFQKSQKFFEKIGGEAGVKGFNAIKVLRQDLFDDHYNKLSAAAKADPEAAENIAKIVNLATGATNLKLPEVVNEITFAGGMEAARWGKLTRNPVKATGIALKALITPDKVSVGDRVFAKVWARRVGEQIGTMASLLVANAVIQNALNPKNPTNLTDPNKPDYLKFKFGDLTIDPTSGMRGAAMFAYGVGKIPFMTKKERRGDSRMEVLGKNAAGYGRGKLAPLYSTIADFFAQQDFNRNPLPFSDDKPSEGHHKLTWGEYAWEKAPLPLAHAAQDMYHSALDNGGDKMTVHHVLDGILSGALSGGTGFRIGEYDAEENKNKHSPFTDEELKDPVFKPYVDAGLEMPNTSLSSEEITDEDAKTKKTVSEYPKDIQDKYKEAHKKNLKQELSDINKFKTVFVKTYKKNGVDAEEVSVAVPEKGDYKEVKINDLSKEEKEQLLKIAQSQATEKTKDEIFNKK